MGSKRCEKHDTVYKTDDAKGFCVDCLQDELLKEKEEAENLIRKDALRKAAEAWPWTDEECGARDFLNNLAEAIGDAVKTAKIIEEQIGLRDIGDEEIDEQTEPG